jgi:hypothetical protein
MISNVNIGRFGGRRITTDTISAAQAIPSTSLTSPWHGWGVPCMLLNSNDGVVRAEPSTWGGVKALYR